MRPILRAALAALLLATAAVAAPPRASTVRASGGRVALVPPSAPNTAAFFVLHNPGPKPLALVKASSPAARATEVHDMVVKDGKSQMRPLARLEIPARDSVALAPGGRHVMLIGLEKPLPKGARVPLTLTFSDRSTLALELEVRPAH